MKQQSQGEQTRETMYYGSLKMRLAKPREITKVVYEPVTLEEFIEIMLDKSPTAIYHSEYSEKQPCYHVTKRIMRSDGGVHIYANAWADKTPIFKEWEKLYNEFLFQGMEYFKF